MLSTGNAPHLPWRSLGFSFSCQRVSGVVRHGPVCSVWPFVSRPCACPAWLRTTCNTCDEAVCAASQHRSSQSLLQSPGGLLPSGCRNGFVSLGLSLGPELSVNDSNAGWEDPPLQRLSAHLSALVVTSSLNCDASVQSRVWRSDNVFRERHHSMPTPSYISVPPVLAN